MARKKRSIVTTVAPTTEAKSTARYQDSFQQNVGKKFEDQIAAAFDVAAKYKGDARSLMNLPSLAAMEQAAQAATQRGAERG
ncbi:MAG: hypothetical protein AAB288_06345, partial [Acidobacteriota bacterium]